MTCNIKKRALSLFLAMAMVLGLLPAITPTARAVTTIICKNGIERRVNAQDIFKTDLDAVGMNYTIGFTYTGTNPGLFFEGYNEPIASTAVETMANYYVIDEHNHIGDLIFNSTTNGDFEVTVWICDFDTGSNDAVETTTLTFITSPGNSSPTVTTPSTITYTDTAADDTFTNSTGTLSASDSDGTIVSYGISGGTAGSTTIGGTTYDVSIEGTYGTLYVNSATGAYVYDPFDIAINSLMSNQSEAFTVTATDNNNATGSATLIVSITGVNDTPANIWLSNSAIFENSGANAVVGSLTTTDVDAGDTFTYSLVDGAGDTDNGAFNIDGNSLRLTNNPDYETKNSYSVRIQTTDAGGLSYQEIFPITINDVNEAPTLTATASDPSFSAGGSAVSLFSGASVSTVEPGQTITSLTITVSNVTVGANEILTVDGTDVALTNGNSVTTAANGFGVTVSVTAGTATVTITKAGGAAVTAAQSLVDALQYKNTSASPTAGIRTVTLTSISDNGGTANGGVDSTSSAISSTVTVTAAAPTVTNVTSTTANGAYRAGDIISITVQFSAPVTVSGTPQLTLETGATDRTADYSGGTGTSTLTFAYTVQAGDTAADLDYSSTTALALNSGSIQASGTPAVLTLPAPGAAGSLGANKAIVIDTTAPSPPEAPDLTADSDSGASNTDNITSDSTPTFTGTAESNSTVTVISSGGGSLGTATADGSGNWSYTMVIALVNGSYSITATATDAAGNTSAPSAGLTIIIDTTAPSAPTVSTSSPSSDNTPTFTGTAEAGSTVTVISSVGGTLGTATADGSGSWSYTAASALADGSHTITATARDAAGNTSVQSTGYPITIDTLTISINDVSVQEGNSGPIPMSFTVALSASSTSPVTVDYATSNGTATAGADYTAVSGTLTFSPGETTKTITVPIFGDTDAEPDETFALTLSNPSSGTFTKPTGTGTIQNDDATVPSAPTGVTASAGNGNATVSFTAPASNGGAAITGYTVTSSPGGFTATGSASPITVTGLTNGTSYTFTVTATSSAGTSSASAASAGVTPQAAVTAPGAPTSVTASAGDGQAIVSFTPPVSDGGAPIAQYTVTSSPGGFTATGSASPITVTGLTNGTSYTFTVTATSNGGTSVPSAASAGVTPQAVVTAPGAPTGVTATTGNGQATVSFTAPASNGGAAITGYTVTSNPGNITATGTGTTITVTGLTNGTAYTFTVTATNAAGTSAASAASAGVTPQATSSGGSSGGSGGSSPSSVSSPITVNGVPQSAGQASTTTSNGRTITTVTVDDTKLGSILEQKGENATVTIPVSTASDVVVGILNGQTVKNMEKAASTLEIKTASVTYTLPASQINIDDVSAQLGSAVALKDIQVSIKIAQPLSDTAKLVENTAKSGGYQLVVSPVQFEISCVSGGKTVDVSRFNGYVERTVAIPDGIDPSKITTGVVLNADGTFRHVPTEIVKIDNKYYAKINSLTNSVYTVIYNPVTFADVENHWAKDAVNDMGSRLVVTGYDAKSYHPNERITRAEFAAIVVRALGLAQGTTESAFDDVSLQNWYNGYVDTAVNYALITGYTSTSYGPNDTITREQAMAILARAMKLTNDGVTLTDSEVNSVLAGYTDGAAVSAYAQQSVASCLKAGIVTGTTATTLSPKTSITRAEVAVMVQRLLEKSKLI